MRPESLDQLFHLMNIIVPLYNHRQELQASCSVQFSRSVVSDSLWPHGPRHTRPPHPSRTPAGAPSGTPLSWCPLTWWCHPTISSSVVPFSSHLQSFPASGSLQMSQFFTSGSQSIGVSASASVLPMHIQDWFPLGWTVWISLQSRLSQADSYLFQSLSDESPGLLCETFPPVCSPVNKPRAGLDFVPLSSELSGPTLNI